MKLTAAGGEMESCQHYWVISQPNGPVSHGICQYCHAEDDFMNSIPKLTPKQFRMQSWEGSRLSRSAAGKEVNNAKG